MSKKRYTLFKAEGDEAKPCAFFGTEQGCRKGDQCPFVHGQTAPVSSPVEEKQSTKRSLPEEPDIAAEATKRSKKDSQPKSKTKIERQQSDGGSTSPPPQAPLPEEVSAKKVSGGGQKKFDLSEFQRRQKEKHMQQRRSGKQSSQKDPPLNIYPAIKHAAFVAPPPSSSFAAPTAPMNLSGPYPSSLPLDDEEEDTKFLFNAVDIAIQGTRESNGNRPSVLNLQPSVSYSIPKTPAHVNLPPMKQPSTVYPSRERPFLPQTEVPHVQQMSGSSYTFPAIASRNSSESISATQQVTPRPPMMLSVAYGDMLRLAQSTSANPKYNADYGFKTDETWVRSRPHGDWSRALPPIIALDCEMCVTEDPVTLVKDPYTLIRFSVVKGLEHGDVIVPLSLKSLLI